MTPAPTEDRAGRIDLVWAPKGGHGRSEAPGWTLYVDGTPVAHTPQDLRPAAAQQWAEAQFGEALTWLLGAPSWYFLAHPCQSGRSL